MIVFKSMFNDVSLGEKSSPSRCLHAEDGESFPGWLASSGAGEIRCVPPVLQRDLMSSALCHSLLGTRRGFAQVFVWIIKKLLQDVELLQGFQTI